MIILLEKMDYDILANSPLFRGFDVKMIESTLETIQHRFKSYRAGEMIAFSGEPVDRLQIVVSGITKGEMVDYTGRVIKIEDIPSPGALAPAFLFGARNVFPVNVIAVTDTELLVIEREDFLKMIMASDKILVNFMDMISNRSQFLSEKIKFLNFKTIKSKLAYYFLQKAGKERDSFHLDMTQNELADFFGVARPSVARALGELEGEGLLIAERKNIRILDKRALADLITG